MTTSEAQIQNSTPSPGPWELARNFGPKDDIEIWHNADLVAIVSNQTELGTLLANARLIVAAPDLLAALQRTLGALLRTGRTSPLIEKIIEEARDAIDAARGKAQ